MSSMSIDQAIGQLRLLHTKAVNRLEQAEAGIQKAEADLADAEAAQAIVQRLAQGVQQRVHGTIADIVSRSLTAVYGERAYQFRIETERKRGKTETLLMYERDGNLLSPRDEASGGFLDVAAFALQLAALSLRKPPLRKVMVLDEPFKFVNVRIFPRIRQLLETLAEEMDFQFIMVTQIEALRTGKIIRIGDEEDAED